MSGANPVEIKSAAAKVGDVAAAPAATALAEPAAKVGDSAAKPRPWTLLSRKQKLWLSVCGMAVVAAAVAYGYKYFVPNPGAAVAQSNAAAVSPPTPKPNEPDKLPPLIKDDELPSVVVPPLVKSVKGEEPVIQRPAPVGPQHAGGSGSGLDDTDEPPIKVRVPDEVKKDKEKDTDKGKEKVKDTDDTFPLVLPPTPGKPADTKKDDDSDDPPIEAPPIPDSSKKEKKKDEPDPFKSTDALGPTPAPLPAEVTEKKEKKDEPIIRIRADDAPKKEKDDKPPVPMLDLDLPVVPPVPGKKDEPAAVRPPVKESDRTPAVKPPDETPIEPPAIKPTMIPDMPPTSPTSPIKVPGQDTPPPPPTVGRTKPDERKDSYDEDWHSKRDGDTYASISQEYLHDARYAKALEAYNRDRRRGDDKWVFVPPTWVLKERFPNMVEESDRPEVRPAGNIRFEPAAPITPASRPAPTPAGGNDEYKVTAESGESIRDIARKVYGSEDAWKRLWTLNDGLDPTRPIPNGTTLRIGR